MSLMAPTTTEPIPIGRVDEEGGGGDDDSDVDTAEFRALRSRLSRLSVEGGGGGDGLRSRGGAVVERAGGGFRVGGGVRERRGSCGGGGGSPGGRALPPPQAWLAVEDAGKMSYGSDPEEQWTRVLQGGGYGGGAAAAAAQRQVQRRSSFSVVRRERAAREAWLDRAWEMKKNWHERNGGAPDADTPVVVVVGKGPPSSPSSNAAGSVGGGGVAMDMEEVRACRDLGLELPSDCTVEIQCYGLSATSSPTHTASATCSCCSSAAASPSVSSPAADDPMDVKARLKVWAQAVALASTTHLGS
ncbi:protein SOGA3-like isoform X2 [Oryza brachyantha]|uniref:protein SOGA3-like isoform X2 n=1 Tax=Oryza brachyantha TaxID=4533 RepID=UPI001AD9DB3F|nr:protein SOGA3-like isoform X2 [Oryza brachyantha]